MKIAICMWYDNNIEDYGNLNRKLNKEYCNKYGYDFIFSNKRNLPNKLPHYERYPLLLNNIGKYDWIMWIDADAFFYKDSIPLENIINHIQFTHTTILSKSIRQIFNNKTPDYEINNGVFLLKNTKENYKFLEKMIDCDDIIDIAEKKHFVYDQAVFRYLYCENYQNFKTNSFILDYGILQHFYDYELPYLKYKPLILHMAGKNQNRIKIVEKYLRTFSS